MYFQCQLNSWQIREGAPNSEEKASNQGLQQDGKLGEAVKKR